MLSHLRNWLRPAQLLVFGYATYIVLGWLVLCLPVCWEEASIGALDNLFMAASAVSTTGLVTVNTPDAYSFWGELAILCLFQIGGLGYMTLGSFAVVCRGHELSRERREMTATAFALPEGFDATRFIFLVVCFTVCVELAGVLGLWWAFSAAGLENALWPAIFHAVSAFCTAGFSVFPDSLEQFRDDFFVNAIVSVLSLSGALGFLVVSDVWGVVTGGRRSLCLTTRIILRFTFGAIFIVAALLFLIEPSITQLSPSSRLLAAWFQSMTALTTVGFNTAPLGSFAAGATMVTVAAMLIGASPSGTGGGIKSTSVSAAFATIRSSIRGDYDPTFHGVRVPDGRIFAAFAAISFYLLTFTIGATLLMLVESAPFEDLLFEAASALGTVGLSRGITGDLTPVGKLTIIAMMFVGRTGPIAFAVALASQPAGADVQSEEKEDDLAV
ncbi:MAG: potassium transporter TrkG [Planctomycetota bacterium]